MDSASEVLRSTIPGNVAHFTERKSIRGEESKGILTVVEVLASAALRSGLAALHRRFLNALFAHHALVVLQIDRGYFRQAL